MNSEHEALAALESAETPHTVETLSGTDCRGYLNTNSVGRLGVVGQGGVDIFPVNYLTHRSTVLFRSAPGLKLIDITNNSAVAFEIDGVDNGQRWSVVVRGSAVRLGSDSEIQDTKINQLPTLTPTDKWNYVRITPRTVTGRRFVAVA